MWVCRGGDSGVTLNGLPGFSWGFTWLAGLQRSSRNKSHFLRRVIMQSLDLRSQSHHDLRSTLLVRSCESRSLWTFPESSSRRCCSCSTKPSCAPCTQSSLYSALYALNILLHMYFAIEHSQEISNILSIWLYVLSISTWSRFFFSAKTSRFFISM